MTIDDDEVLIENLREKLTLAQKSLKRALSLFVERGERGPLFGVQNDELKRLAAKNALAAVNAILENETKLNEAIESAGRPDELRKSTDS